MSRRKSGVFDPDYRRAGWNKSRYAPRRGGQSITQVAGLFAGVAFFAYYYGVPALFTDTTAFVRRSTAGIVVGGGIAFAVFLFFGTWLYNREYKRLRKEEGLLTTAEINAPEVKARRKSAQTRALAATKFEQEVAVILNHMLDHYTAEVVGGRGDGGVDIQIMQNGKVVGVVQCKQYDERKSLPPSFIRELAGVKAQKGVGIAYLVTTARFTQESRVEAEKYGIRLIDGAKLAELKKRVEEKLYGQQIPN